MKNLSAKSLVPVAKVVGLVGLLCLGVVLVCEFTGREAEERTEEPVAAVKERKPTQKKMEKRKNVVRKQADAQQADVAEKRATTIQKKNVKNRRAPAALVAENLYAHLKGEDRELCEKIQEALDGDNFEVTVAVAQKALTSKNPEVRQNAVEALGWFGSKSLSKLMPMMADPNEDVSQVAKDAWEMGLDDLDDATLKLAAAQAALQTLNDEDTLSMIGSEFASAAFDLIDGVESDTVAQSRRIEIVSFLTEVIESPEVGTGAEARREACKEIFEQITSHEWVNVEEAEKYLQDPENYEPPE